MKYRAFLSYSHADRKWARWLHRALESYRRPGHLKAMDGGELPKRLSPVFRDRDELPSTASLSDAVNDALAKSENLIVICSPRAAVSRWVNEEIRSFRKLGKSDKIYCFVVDGEPGSGDENDCFPPALTAPDEPGGTSREPVAADARPRGDGRKNAMLKIAAGMLGVGFDALRQRELRRRQQRMAAITAGSITIAALTIVLAINAVIARDEADMRRAQAEDLIDFMLGDLQEQLRQIGRLDVFESVGDKALAYFAAQPVSDDTAYTLSQRARNLRQIGEVRMEQGNLEPALEAFGESLLITERLASQMPDNADAQIGLANSLFYVGYVHWQRGDLQKARTQFENVIPIVNSVSERDGKNPRWLAEEAYAYTNLGRVLELEGALEDALDAYRSVMEANRRLLELEPDNSEWELELGFAHNNIGKVVVALGRLDAAETHYRSDLEIKNRLHATNTAHNVHRSYLGVSQYYLGRLLVLKGAYDEAMENLTAARDNFIFLNEVDPQRVRWLVRRANIERELGKAQERKGQNAEAIFFMESSVDILERASKRDDGNASWKRDFLRSLLVSADFASRRGNLSTAHTQIAAATVILGELLENEATNFETRELSVYLAVCRARSAEHDYADRHFQSALDTLDQFFSGSTDPRILELRAAALDGLGDYQSAAAIRAELRTMGYVGRGL